jgi:hypothetical protein
MTRRGACIGNLPLKKCNTNVLPPFCCPPSHQACKFRDEYAKFQDAGAQVCHWISLTAPHSTAQCSAAQGEAQELFLVTHSTVHIPTPRPYAYISQHEQITVVSPFISLAMHSCWHWFGIGSSK